MTKYKEKNKIKYKLILESDTEFKTSMMNQLTFFSRGLESYI